MKGLILFLFTLPLFSAEYRGLLVKFKPEIKAKEKDHLHQQLKTKLDYRSTPTNRDALSIGKNNEQLAALKSKCAQYRKTPLVKSCFPAKLPTYPDCIHCNTVPAENGLLSSIVKALDLCSPYPAIYQGSDIETPRFGKQTKYWAQEAIGGPETIEFMNAQPKGHSPSIGIIDAGFSPESLNAACSSDELRKTITEAIDPTDHGDPVTQLICGDTPPSISAAGTITRVGAAETEKFTTAKNSTLKAFNDILGLKSTDPIGTPVNPPEIVSASMSFGEAYLEEIDSISHNSLFVMAASNDFPVPLTKDITETATKVVVGSIAPDGSVSDFSSAGEQVTICAPSDNSLQSSDGHNDVTFSGTSGATPLVTSALSNVLSFLPGITTEEANKMLVNSAIVTAGTPGQYPYNDGMGSLNSFKLIKAAAKLRTNWPANRSQISSFALYDDKNEAKEMFDRSQQLLKEDASCEERKQGLSLLRKAFFLDSGNAQYRRALAQIYRDQGYEAQARYYSPSRETAQIPEVKAKLDQRKLLDLARNLKPENMTATFKQMKDLFNSGTPLFTNYNIFPDLNWMEIMTQNFHPTEDAGYIDAVIHFLMKTEQKINSNWTFGITRTRLSSFAVNTKNTQLLEYLVKVDEDIDLSEPLLRSIAFNEKDEIDLVLNSGGNFDVNSTIDGFKDSAFGYAVINNSPELVERLLKYNPDLNQKIHVDVIYENGYAVTIERENPIPLKEWIQLQGNRFDNIKILLKDPDT